MNISKSDFELYQAMQDEYIYEDEDEDEDECVCDEFEYCSQCEDDTVIVECPSDILIEED